MKDPLMLPQDVRRQIKAVDFPHERPPLVIFLLASCDSTEVEVISGIYRINDSWLIRKKVSVCNLKMLICPRNRETIKPVIMITLAIHVCQILTPDVGHRISLE